MGSKLLESGARVISIVTVRLRNAQTLHHMQLHISTYQYASSVTVNVDAEYYSSS